MLIELGFLNIDAGYIILRERHADMTQPGSREAVAGNGAVWGSGNAGERAGDKLVVAQAFERALEAIAQVDDPHRQRQNHDDPKPLPAEKPDRTWAL